MHEVQGDLTIQAFGENLMQAFDTGRSGEHPAGTVVVTAVREAVGLPWTLTTETATTDPVTAADRETAVTAMVDLAVRIGQADGYSATVPHGLTAAP